MTEMWWDSSHGYSDVLGGHRIFIKMRKVRRGSLNVKQQLNCGELLYRLDNRVGEHLQVRIRGEVSEGDITLGLG